MSPITIAIEDNVFYLEHEGRERVFYCMQEVTNWYDHQKKLEREKAERKEEERKEAEAKKKSRVVTFLYEKSRAIPVRRMVRVTREDSNYLFGIDMDIDEPRTFLKNSVVGMITIIS